MTSWRQDAEVICGEHGVRLSDVVTGPSTKLLVKARRAIALMLRQERKLSYPLIGRLLNRDQSTIQYLIKPKRRAQIKERAILRAESRIP